MNLLTELHYKILLFALEHRWLNKYTWKTFKKLQDDRFIQKLKDL